MGSIRVRPKTNTLFIDFRYQNTRCREQTLLEDNSVNRRKLEIVLKKIEAEITLGSFEYEQYFPNSNNAGKFETASSRGLAATNWALNSGVY